MEKKYQCPTCNSVIPPYVLDELCKSWKPFFVGMAYGAIGCMGLLIGLWAIIGLTGISLTDIIALYQV